MTTRRFRFAALCAALLAALPTAACAPAAAPPLPGAAPAREIAGRAEILWDRYGVPHIHARDTEALLWAFGWAQARNHGDLVLRLYGESRGRAAEYWGEARLDDDRWVHTVRLPDEARAAHAALPAEQRRLFDAFAAGFNAYAARHPERIAEDARRVLPVDGTDVVAQSLGVGLLFSSARPRAQGWAAQPPGSNAWAIGPRRSASGNAMLLTNPHLAWEGAYTFFEARWSAPGIDGYGVALVGTPALAIAFNAELGWTHTVNTQDTEDLYRLELAGGGYRWDGAVRGFAADTLRIRVRRGEAIDSVVHVRRRSVHGPVIGERGEQALALRSVPFGWETSLERVLAMLRARDLAGFEDALRRSPPVGFNVVYADRAGNIMYHYGGTTPRRPRGDHAFWQGIVPGDSAALLWTELHGYDEMPRVLNPPAGWVQNANDPPWFATYPAALDPAAFPGYLAPRGFAARPRQSVRLLAGDTTRLTLEEMIRRAMSTEVELAGKLVPDLVAAARQSGSPAAREAAELLARWDRTTDAESRGGVLFAAWYAEYTRRAAGRLFATAWSAADPLGTPRGVGAPAEAVAALEAAATDVARRWGRADVAWGEVHRLRRDGVDVPASGGPGQLGVFRVLGFAPDEDGRSSARFGDTYVAAIEFSTPVRARALTVYGNASQPGSPHRSDQLGLHARREMRPVWLTRAEVEANLRDREVF
jgi:acyl-homoserine-lactone acylase